MQPDILYKLKRADTYQHGQDWCHGGYFHILPDTKPVDVTSAGQLGRVVYKSWMRMGRVRRTSEMVHIPPTLSSFRREQDEGTDEFRYVEGDAAMRSAT